MRRREFLAFTAPSAVTMILLMVAPLVTTLYLSLQRFTYGSSPQWLGLHNYTEVLGSHRFWAAVGFTLGYTAATVAGKIVVGFALALALDRVIRGRSFFLGLLLVPLVVPPVVSALIFSWTVRSEFGLYTWMLDGLGVHIGWFSQQWPARILLVLQGVWQDAAFAALVLLAGLRAMSREPLEAAIVDGANWWQRQRHIVVPALRGLFVFVAMMGVMDAFRVFDPIAAMTKGGPSGSTESLMWFAYNTAFDQQALGLGSAISILTVLGILLLLVPFLVSTYRAERTA